MSGEGDSLIESRRYGHGCFGEYLHRIGAEESVEQAVECKQYGAEMDSASHMVEYSNFAAQRATLLREIGRGLSPAAFVKALLEEGA